MIRVLTTSLLFLLLVSCHLLQRDKIEISTFNEGKDVTLRSPEAIAQFEQLMESVASPDNIYNIPETPATEEEEAELPGRPILSGYAHMIQPVLSVSRKGKKQEYYYHIDRHADGTYFTDLDKGSDNYFISPAMAEEINDFLQQNGGDSHTHYLPLPEFNH